MAKTAQDEQMARHISTRELTDVHIPVYSDQCWSLQYQPAVRCANINSAHEPCYWRLRYRDVRRYLPALYVYQLGYVDDIIISLGAMVV